MPLSTFPGVVQIERMKITPANAKVYQAKSLAKRRELAFLAKERLAELSAIERRDARVPGVHLRLLRTRLQIDKVRDALDSAIARHDWRAMSSLVDSVCKLEELERVLDERPLVSPRKPSDGTKTLFSQVLDAAAIPFDLQFRDHKLTAGAGSEAREPAAADSSAPAPTGTPSVTQEHGSGTPAGTPIPGA